MFARAIPLALAAACWMEKTTVKASDPTTPPAAAQRERAAIVRIDAQPSGKKFQGVWLEFAGAKRWVIDYRPRSLWRGFEDAEVIVTGHCYVPFGQAINAPHFRIDSMKFAKPMRGRTSIMEVGPEVELLGKLVDIAAAAGSKREGSSEQRFRADDGEAYAIEGSDDALSATGERVRVRARTLEIDMSFVARTGGPWLYIYDVRDPTSQDDPAHAPKLVTCPGD